MDSRRGRTGMGLPVRRGGKQGAGRMWKNYIKVTIRNLLKHKGYSFINVAGLSVGMACCIFILAFIVRELSYDRFNENCDRICRIAVDAEISGRKIKVATIPAPMGPQLVEDFPEVLDVVRFRKSGNVNLEYEGKKHAESGVLYADDSFFEVFSYRLVRGDGGNALAAPFSIVLTRSAAEKYFGGGDPMGKTLKAPGDDAEYTVTGVVEDPPADSHFSFNALMSFETLFRTEKIGMNWYNFNYQTYLLMSEDADREAFEAKLAGFTGKYLSGFLEAIGGKVTFYVQPLASIHLHSNIESELGASGDIRYIYIFAGIGIFILALACINFINLSTARSANRAKEVGLRKVLGAERVALMGQFLGESFIMAVIAAIAAYFLVLVFMPRFNDLAGQKLDMDFFADPRMLFGIMGLVLFVGLAAGSYPAVYLSRFTPAGVLKGKARQGASGSRFRRVLVVFQFTISIMLIIGTGIIIGQLDYMRRMNLGFDKEQVMVVPLRSDGLRADARFLRKELATVEGVASASVSMMVPGEESYNATAYFIEGSGGNQSVLLENFTIDEEFVETFGIKVTAGRNFSLDYPSDPGSAVLINERAASELGWAEPVGKKLYFGSDDDVNRIDGYYTVVGVIEDIHYRSLHHSVEPLMLRFSNDFIGRISLKISTEDMPRAVKAIENKWGALTSGQPFEYFFLDEYFDGLYRSEETLAGIFRVFTVFAVFIGCLGLFGLVSFAAEQRTKEIGIRKVLGSTSGGIVLLLCREFMALVMLANIFAWPAAYLAMKKWLQSFPYQGDISVSIFFLAGVSAIVLALLTVSYRAVRAANANPADALKYE